MKFFVLCVILFITTNLYPQNGNLWTDGEIWFCFADNESSNYYVKATRHNQNEPLFGVNFMEGGLIFMILCTLMIIQIIHYRRVDLMFCVGLIICETLGIFPQLEKV